MRKEHLVQTLSVETKFISCFKGSLLVTKIRRCRNEIWFDSFFVLHRLIPTYFYITCFYICIKYIRPLLRKHEREAQDQGRVGMRRTESGVTYFTNDRPSFIEKRLCDAEILISVWKTRLELTDNKIRGGKQMLLSLFSLFSFFSPLFFFLLRLSKLPIFFIVVNIVVLHY